MFKIDCYKRALLLDGLYMYLSYVSWNTGFSLQEKVSSQGERSITLIITENRAILDSLTHLLY